MKSLFGTPNTRAGLDLLRLQKSLGKDSARCWKRSSQILVHTDVIASHSCHPHIHDRNLKGALLITGGDTVNSLSYVQETSRRLFELYDTVAILWSQSGGHGQQQYSCKLWHLSDPQLGPKVLKDETPHSIKPPTPASSDQALFFQSSAHMNCSLCR